MRMADDDDDHDGEERKKRVFPFYCLFVFFSFCVVGLAVLTLDFLFEGLFGGSF